MAFVAFFRTPRDERYAIYKPSNTENDPEFAPEYTKKERFWLIAKSLLWFVPILSFCQLWFFDWLGEYAKVAHCYEYGPVKGTHIIIYGLFVGLPFTLAIMLFGFEGVKAIKVIKIGQFPLPGQKVFKPTKYKYGNVARVNGAIVIGALVFLLGLAAWGVGQAKEISRDIKPCLINQLTSGSNALRFTPPDAHCVRAV
ncbi:hypothetical protein [Cycloclasticus sp. P1]|uniref:hypothetical protein n=1 Tax=Cycloclasticus sp. (strain P1) TaxID=385025 RepID=UPI0011D1B9B1|nr:hypothetical protein [Cycloclasticus sp. P1]